MSEELVSSPTPYLERVVEFVPFAARDAIKLSVSIVRELICKPTRSGKVCSEKQAVQFMMLCRSRGLNPFEGDAYLIGFDGKNGPEFSIFPAHQAFLKRAEAHPEYDGMDSGVIVSNSSAFVLDREGDFTLDDDVLLGGWATVYFKTRKHPIKRRLKLSAFRKPYGRWTDDPAGMIVKCAEKDALSSAFPSMLAGLFIEREFSGVLDASAAPVQLPRSRSDQLADRLEAANDAAAEESAPTMDQVAAESLEREDLARRFLEAIAEAANLAELETRVTEQLEYSREWLGELAGEVAKALESRRRELLAEKAARRGRQP